MHELGMIMDSIMLPEAGFFLAFFVLFIFLWVILRRIKGFKETLSIVELGHLEFYYQSSEMRSWRLRLINTDRTNMKDLQGCSQQVLYFFDRLGFLVQKKILSREQIWQSFGIPVWGYFNLLLPYIQWLRTEERDSDLHVYFENLNEAVYRLNRKMDRKRAKPFMVEEELDRFIEEEKATLSDS